MPEQRIRSPQCLHNIEDKFIDLSRSSSQHRNALMHMIKSCGKLKNLNKARLLHSQSKHLMPQDLYITVSVLTMLAKCGAMKEAVEIFEQIPKRTVVPWNSLISGHVQNGQPELAMKCFLQMQDEGVTPDSITLTCILKACGSLGSLEIGTKIHALIEEKGLLQQDVMLGNTLVNMYCKFGLIGKAHEILEQFPRRNVASWSALIAGYAQHGRGEEALRCFYSMQNEGISPDSVSFICILKACGSIGSLKIGEEIHDEVKKQGLLGKDIVLGTALVDMYAKCGALEKAHKVLEELPERNVVSWSALITGYVQHGHGDVAVKCFMEMLDEGISPDAVTFVCVLMACGSTGSLKVGQDIHAEVKEQNLLGKDMALGTTLLHMYAKCGVLNKAHEVFELLPQRDVVSWNALMDGHAQMGQVKTVFKLLNEIRLKRILPDPITFLIVLNACSHSGEMCKAQTLYDNMTKRFGVAPKLKHHTSMVLVFGCAGHFDKVISVIEMMPSFYDCSLWLALLCACKKWGNVKLGRHAFDQAIQMSDNLAAAYVHMGSIYADAGMQEDMEKVQAMQVMLHGQSSQAICMGD